jgi:hypothetical protein
LDNNNNTNPVTEENKTSIFSGNEFSTSGYDKHIRQARNAIFGAAALLLLNLIIMMATIPEGYAYLWLDISVWGLFIVGFVLLGLWTRKKPYTAIVSALILYCIFIILNAFIDVTTIFKGLLVKIIIIVLLVKGINDAREAQRMKEDIGNS